MHRSILARAARPCHAPHLRLPLAQSVWPSGQDRPSNCLHTECRVHDPIQESNPSHYRENTGHGLRSELRRDNLSNDAPANSRIQHPNGWWARRAAADQAWPIINASKQYGAFRRLIISQQKHHRADNEAHPSPAQLEIPNPTNSAHQSHLAVWPPFPRSHHYSPS